MTDIQVTKPFVPIKDIVRIWHIRRMVTLPADIMLYQSCCTAASGGGVSTWTAAKECKVSTSLGPPSHKY